MIVHVLHSNTYGIYYTAIRTRLAYWMYNALIGIATEMLSPSHQILSQGCKLMVARSPARGKKCKGRVNFVYCMPGRQALASNVYPGAKVRVNTREAWYYAKTRAFASLYAIISRASSRSARCYVRRRNFARSRVKIISARQFKGVHERCVKAAPPFTRDLACIDG